VSTHDISAKIQATAGFIAKSTNVVVFTGAGVSTESGIPDFRSAGGIWSRFDPDDFTIQKFLTSEETRRKQWQILVEEGLFRDIQPNAAHYAIAELEKLGKLDCVITQNIDDLHQKAGNSRERVYELHGNMQWATCLDCRARFPMESIREMLKNGEKIPVCRQCGGMLKPDVVFFGESLPIKTIEAAAYHSQEADVFIVVGSSLLVHPASYMPGYAKSAGARLIIINLSETPYDNYADVLLPDSAGRAMSGIVDELKRVIQSERRDSAL